MLPYSEIQAGYRVLSAFRLPHHAGSLVRGILGRALRLVSCPTTPTCDPTSACQHATACTYSALFDPPLPAPPPRLLRGATSAPPPLLPLIPAPGALELAPGDTFTLAVRVLGRLDPAREHHLVSALERLPSLELGLGRDAGRLCLDAVTFLGPRNRSPSPPEIDPAAPPRHATLTFETPAWIEHDEHLAVAPDFRTLFRHFDRRIAILRDLYGEPEPDPDPSSRFHDLDARCDEISIRPSLRAVRWERHSLERDERHPMKGLLGTVALSGDLAPFVPTLRLAELVHVGKMTSHGLGRLRVELG